MKNVTFVILFSMLLGCSSAPSTERTLSDFAPETLRVRRPEGAGADPKAEPGMPEYQSEQKPNSKFDCKYAHELFIAISLPEVRVCLNELYFEAKKKGEHLHLLYHLKRGSMPYLEFEDLTDPESTNCLKRALPKIPIPREIMYQGHDTKSKEEKFLCYASRIDTTANEWMGLELPIAKWALSLEIPLPSSPNAPPETDDELQRTLISWALTPFRDEKGKFRAKIVPDAICRQCLGEKGMLQKSTEDSFFWPGP